MSIRKRKGPTPGFKMPQPWSPRTGEHAALQTPGEYPYCALMQVAAEDEYDDYVICRGFDTRIRRFIDYAAGDSDKPGIMVAKPFGNRVKCYYQIGQVFPAFLPIQGTSSDDYTPPSPSTVPWRTGQNPGTASTTCVGQPQDLSETIDELVDHNSKKINWMLIDSGPGLLWVVLNGDLAVCGSTTGRVVAADAAGEWCETCSYTTLTVTDVFGAVAGSALAVADEVAAGYNALVMRVMSSDGATACHWAPIAFGTNECCSPASPPSPSPSPSPESPSSPSPSPSPSPSSPSSPSPSSPSSPSPSSPSSPSLSPSPSPSPESPSSPKSAAILSVPWAETGYAAVFTVESPGVDFTDMMVVEIKQRNQHVEIDPKFFYTIEPGTMACTGAQPNQPVLIGAEVVGKFINVKFSAETDSDVRVVFSLRGTRRGFAGVRFPERTAEQFEANERFLKSAYPGA